MPDHDALFKQLLTTFFVEFVELFFPDLATLLDRDHLVFLDKELFSEIAEPDRREADLVIRAKVRDQEAFLIVHLEHQAQPAMAFDRRMFRYFARLYEQHNLPIYPIALFSYQEPRTLAPAQHQVTFPGFVVLDFRYRVVQLNRLDWRAFLRHPNPLATGLMARMRIMKKDRARVKLECLRQLANLDLDMSRRHMLGYFVDTYLPLDRTEQRRLERDLETLLPVERITAMEMITSWEREGIKQGRHEAALAITTRLLTRKFGALATNVQKRVAKLATNDLEDLSEALLDFTSLSDLRGWLDTRPARSAASS